MERDIITKDRDLSDVLREIEEKESYQKDRDGYADEYGDDEFDYINDSSSPRRYDDEFYD